MVDMWPNVPWKPLAQFNCCSALVIKSSWEQMDSIKLTGKVSTSYPVNVPLNKMLELFDCTAAIDNIACKESLQALTKNNWIEMHFWAEI